MLKSLSSLFVIKVCGGDLPYVNPESLEEKHVFNFREALHSFSSTKKMGGQEFCDQYQTQLEKELGEMWESYGKLNQVEDYLKTFNFFFYWIIKSLDPNIWILREYLIHIVAFCFDMTELFLIVFVSLCCKSPKISSVPSGRLQCCLSWCASSTCCRGCFSLLACLPSPWCVTVLWAWSWCPCWLGPSSATLVSTGMWAEPSTRLQVSFWSRWEEWGWRKVCVCICLYGCHGFQFMSMEENVFQCMHPLMPLEGAINAC